MQLTENDLLGVDLNGWLHAQKPFSHSLSRLRSQLNQAMEAKNTAEAHACFVLLTVLHLHLHADHPQEPFGSPTTLTTLNLQEGRLTESFKGNLQLIRPSVQDAAVRARIGDVLWVFGRDAKAGHAAVDDYLVAAQVSMTEQHWPESVQQLGRASNLVRSLGKTNPKIQDVAATIEQHLQNHLGAISLLPLKLMQILQEHNTQHAQQYAQAAEHTAQTLETQSKWWEAAEFWRMAAGWHTKSRDPEAARRCNLMAAETFFQQALKLLQAERPHYGQAVHTLEECIQELRRIGGTLDRVMDVRQVLDEAQLHQLEELKPIPLELTEEDLQLQQQAQEHARAAVRGLPLRDALVRFSLHATEVNPEVLKKMAEDQKSETPLYSRFARRMLGPQGRTQAVASSEDKILHASIGEDKYLAWQMHAVYHILPMRDQILDDHNLWMEDLRPFVYNNLLVRKGRSESVLMGLHHGFTENYLSALHLLIPQVEDSMRHLLEQMDILPYKYDGDGIQDELNLNVLLRLDPFKATLSRILGEEVVYDLQFLLIERVAANFRNVVAHGLVADGAYFTPLAAYAWFAIYRFYMTRYRTNIFFNGYRKSQAAPGGAT